MPDHRASIELEWACPRTARGQAHLRWAKGFKTSSGSLCDQLSREASSVQSETAIFAHEPCYLCLRRLKLLSDEFHVIIRPPHRLENIAIPDRITLKQRNQHGRVSSEN